MRVDLACLLLLSYSHSHSYTLILENKLIHNTDCSKWSRRLRRRLFDAHTMAIFFLSYLWHTSLDLHVSVLSFGFVTTVKMEQNDSQLLLEDIMGARIHGVRLHWRCSLFRTSFPDKNKYTELQVHKLWACVCVCEGGIIYCITQSKNMELEDILFRVVIVHLHTQSCHTNKGSFQMQLDYAGAAALKSVTFKVFRIDITLDNSPLGISNRNFAWNTNVDRQISKEFVFLVNENIWCCYYSRYWRETCALAMTVFALNSVSNTKKGLRLQTSIYQRFYRLQMPTCIKIVVVWFMAIGLLIPDFTLGYWLQACLAVFIPGRLILLTEGSTHGCCSVASTQLTCLQCTWVVCSVLPNNLYGCI